MVKKAPAKDTGLRLPGALKRSLGLPASSTRCGHLDLPCKAPAEHGARINCSPEGDRGVKPRYAWEPQQPTVQLDMDAELA